MPLKLNKNSCCTEVCSLDGEILANIFDGKIYPSRKLTDNERQEISSFLFTNGIMHQWV